jgi:hypothetical protein
MLPLLGRLGRYDAGEGVINPFWEPDAPPVTIAVAATLVRSLCQAVPKSRSGKLTTFRSNFVVGWMVGLEETIKGIDPVANSSRSERTRAIETPCEYLPVFHTALEDDGTGSSTRRCVPPPSATVPDRCRFPCCALQGEARCGGHAEHDGFSARRRPCPPVRNQGENAADHAGLGAAEWHRAAVRPGLSRDSWLRSVRSPREYHAHHRSNGICCHV